MSMGGAMGGIDHFAHFVWFRKLLSFQTRFCCSPDLDLGAFWVLKSEVFLLKINIDAARLKNANPHASVGSEVTKNRFQTS